MLVVLVSFTDKTISDTEVNWRDKCFGTTVTSINTYYKENSNNSFYFEPAVESGGTADDGVISITILYAHPNYGSNFSLPSKNQLIYDIFNAADQYINYKTYDTNNS